MRRQTHLDYAASRTVPGSLKVRDFVRLVVHGWNVAALPCSGFDINAESRQRGSQQKELHREAPIVTKPAKHCVFVAAVCPVVACSGRDSNSKSTPAAASFQTIPWRRRSLRGFCRSCSMPLQEVVAEPHVPLLRPYFSRQNRRTQAVFACVRCGREANADHVVAINVLERGQCLFACGEKAVGPLEEAGTRGSSPSHRGLGAV